MKMRCMVVATLACLAAASTAGAADQIRRTSGTTLGRVEQMTPWEVSVKEQSTLVTKVPVNEIVTLYFDAEPAALRTARAHLTRGAYEDALDSLNSLKEDELSRDMIKQDVEFYKALCAAKLALNGTGEVDEAGSQMAAFLKNNPSNYHYLEASEAIGDLLAAKKDYVHAEKFYSRLADAPWPDYKMRAKVAVGRAQLAQGKAAEATKSFEEAIALDVGGDAAASQRLAATLGKAGCLAAEKKFDEAITMVEDIVAKADPENADLNARAYNTLGDALQQAGRNKDAIMAYLHVDLIYHMVPDAHAEALSKLAKLWEAEHKTERAVRCRTILAEQYRNSQWSK